MVILFHWARSFRREALGAVREEGDSCLASHVSHINQCQWVADVAARLPPYPIDNRINGDSLNLSVKSRPSLNLIIKKSIKSVYRFQLKYSEVLAINWSFQACEWPVWMQKITYFLNEQVTISWGISTAAMSVSWARHLSSSPMNCESLIHTV